MANPTATFHLKKGFAKSIQAAKHGTATNDIIKQLMNKQQVMRMCKVIDIRCVLISSTVMTSGFTDIEDQRTVGDYQKLREGQEAGASCSMYIHSSSDSHEVRSLYHE